MRFSPQQQEFINWALNGRGSCVLEAVAGAGKTTTILEAACNMPGGVAILAYNKKIADEISGKLKQRGIDFRKVEAGTVHSFGFRAYRKAFPNVRVDGDKVRNLIDGGTAGIPKYMAAAVAKLVSMAKQQGFGFLIEMDYRAGWMAMIDKYDIVDAVDVDEDGLTDQSYGDLVAQLVSFGITVLTASNRVTDMIDFDDMIYMPLLMGLPFWQFQTVFVDEAQDTNATRRALVRAILRRGGRVIAVGDRHQAIYGFTGADNDSLDLIAQDFNAIRMPLTVTFRCPKKVVAFSQQWVSHIKAADSAPEGAVSSISAYDFYKEWVRAKRLDGNVAILSRTTKPLVSLAFALIAQGTACRVEGRDIGSALKQMAAKWKTARTLEKLRSRLEDHLERQTTKLLAKKQEAKLQQVEDQVQTLLTIVDYCESKGETETSAMLHHIDQIFGDNVEGMTVLSTIHKSKGREWNTVMWLNRAETCPSKWARQQWQMDQEDNLCYVAATRAQDHLIELPDLSDLRDIAASYKEA